MISIKLTGFERIEKFYRDAPAIFEKELGIALKNSIGMAGTESQRLTPVDTGLLQSSIGGEGGYSYVRGLTAGIGTNVKYAVVVHEKNIPHKIGESKFLEKGLKNAESYIQSEMDKAMERLSNKL